MLDKTTKAVVNQNHGIDGLPFSVNIAYEPKWKALNSKRLARYSLEPTLEHNKNYNTKHSQGATPDKNRPSN